MKHKVEWRGRQFEMSALTRGQKKEFCEWFIKKRQEEIIQDFIKFPEVMNLQLDGLRERIWWSAKGMSPAVRDAIRGLEGGHLYIRMMLKVDEKTLSKADLIELIDEKEGEQNKYVEELIEKGVEPPYPPVNDYCLAFMTIHEEMDPKVNGPENGSAPTPTP